MSERLTGLLEAGLVPVAAGQVELDRTIMFAIGCGFAGVAGALLAIVLLRARGPWRALRTVRPSRTGTGLS